MTGPRELTILRALDAFNGVDANTQDARMVLALQSIAVNLAALTDLYELEIACLAEPECDEDGEDASEAHPS